MAEEKFIPLSPEHQRQRARFLKVQPIILTEDQQRRQHAHNVWMRLRHCSAPGSSEP